MADRYLKNLLGEDEQIIFVTRQHWLILLSEIFSEGILTIVTLILISLVYWFWFPNPLILLCYFLLLLPLSSIARDVLIWRNRRFIVTNWRVMKIAGIFNKDVTDSSLEKVNDVKLEQSFVGRLLNYGNIEILTASESGINKFSWIGQPIRLKKAMLNAKEQLEQGHPGLRKSEEKNPLELISELDSLRKNGALSESEFEAKKAQLLARL
ncbi:MAG: PH domain-containing protein [Pyrinomonadaceae bacterium]